MTSNLSKQELSNRRFRRGALLGGAIGLFSCLIYIIYLMIATYTALNSGEIEGPVKFLVFMGFLYSFPGGAAFCIAGTAICALLGGAVGIAASTLLYRPK